MPSSSSRRTWRRHGLGDMRALSDGCGETQHPGGYRARGEGGEGTAAWHAGRFISAVGCDEQSWERGVGVARQLGEARWARRSGGGQGGEAG